MDPELKRHLEAMEQRMLRHVDDRIDALDAKVDAQGRELRQGQADIIQRLDQGFAARKEDEDMALREIRAVKCRVTSLERRVKLLESPQR